jgi:RHS repeat-associated protein
VVTEDLRFFNDGWQCLAELNATNNTVIRTYLWGLDLSGTQTGAGGVGGLLAMDSSASGTHFYTYDGNGNVAGFVNASTATVSATHEYSPFGQVLRKSGTAVADNRYRFSTKKADDTTDSIAYEYRHYRPQTGRWLSRDPIAEKGALNLYSFVRQSPISLIDPRGTTPKSNGDPDCEYGCASFVYENNPSGGGTCICWKNKKCPCIWDVVSEPPFKDIPVGQCPAADACTLAHEQTHCNSLNSFCVFTPWCATQLKPLNIKVWANEECQARSAERDCLRNLAPDELCEDVIQNKIDALEIGLRAAGCQGWR